MDLGICTCHASPVAFVLQFPGIHGPGPEPVGGEPVRSHHDGTGPQTTDTAQGRLQDQQLAGLYSLCPKEHLVISKEHLLLLFEAVLS